MMASPYKSDVLGPPPLTKQEIPIVILGSLSHKVEVRQYTPPMLRFRPHLIPNLKVRFFQCGHNQHSPSQRILMNS